MTRDEIINAYFEWLCDTVGERRRSKQYSFDKLLMRLHSTEFRYSIPMDKNRAAAGIALRQRFVDSETDLSGVPECLDGPCSVLELMVALSIYCEEHIMDDPHFGDRTGQWFWEMVSSLGLGGMFNSHFDKVTVDEALERFLNREYEPNGKGGLFTIRNSDRDWRDAEIFHQLCGYLNTIT